MCKNSMKCANFLTVVAQVMQALLALIMVVVVSAALEDRNFVIVSLSLGTAQIGAVMVYEWLRLGTMRRFPGPSEETAIRLASIKTIALLSTLLLTVGILVLIFTDVAEEFFNRQSLIPIALITVLLGLGDLLLVVIRFSGEVAKSAILQLTRAVLLFVVPAIIAVQTGNPIYVLYGVSLAHTIVFVISIFVFPSIQISRLRDAQFSEISGIAGQGIPAAVASQLHFLVSYSLRITSVEVLGADAASAAGFVLAMDIVQKPFPILATLATALFIPRLNKAFDENDQKGTRLALSQIYGVLGGGALLGAFALTCLLPAFAQFAVGEEVRPHFLEFSRKLLVYFCLLLFVQSGVSVTLHLHSRTRLATLYSGLHLIMTYVGYLIWRYNQYDWSSMLWLANGAIALTLIFSSWHSKTWEIFVIRREVVLLATISAALNLSLLWALPVLGIANVAVLSLFTFAVCCIALAKYINLFR